MNDLERRIAKGVGAAVYLSRMNLITTKQLMNIELRIANQSERHGIEVTPKIKSYNAQAVEYLDAFGLSENDDPEEVLP